MDELRIWVSNLQYEHKTFEKGSTPGGAEGGEVYSFEMTEGEYPGFSYIIS